MTLCQLYIRIYWCPTDLVIFIKKANIDGSSDFQGTSMKIQKGSKNRSNVLSSFIPFTQA
jgi:hypothetical protein